jgi:hypothetical protein
VERQAYVTVAARPFDPQCQSVPVDGERLDADRAVQALGLGSSLPPSAVTAQDQAAASTERARSAAAGAAVQV